MSQARDTVPFVGVDLRQLLVPWDKCVGVNLGPVPTTLVDELEQRGFDQAPAFAPTRAGRMVLGLVRRARLRELADTGGELTETELKASYDYDDWIRFYPSLNGLLLRMAERSALIVTWEADSEAGPGHGTFGLITRADLNKHLVRGLVYDIVAKLETTLADLVDRSFTDHLEWIRRLSEDGQARVLGYWEVSKLKGVDVGPVTCATLADLLNTVAKHKGLHTQLGYESRSAFEEATGRIPDVRNQVMHPVRPLITDADSCRRLEAVLAEALRLTWRMQRAQERPQPR